VYFGSTRVCFVGDERGDLRDALLYLLDDLLVPLKRTGVSRRLLGYLYDFYGFWCSQVYRFTRTEMVN
jgi:hypothetical protein